MLVLLLQVNRYPKTCNETVIVKLTWHEIKHKYKNEIFKIHLL